MIDPIRMAAGAAAERLKAKYGTALVTEVEVGLRVHPTPRRSGQFVFDPLSLGGLIVASANLAWTIYADQRKKTPTSSGEEMANTIREELQKALESDVGDRVMIIDVVVDEIIRIGDELR